MWSVPGLWGEQVEGPCVSLPTPCWLLLLHPSENPVKTTLHRGEHAQNMRYPDVQSFLLDKPALQIKDVTISTNLVIVIL